MNLTDKPKMFLFQMCRGSEPVQAASAPLSQPAADDISYDLSRFDFKPTVPVDADILVCFASGGQLVTPFHISERQSKPRFVVFVYEQNTSLTSLGTKAPGSFRKHWKCSSVTTKIVT